MNLRHLNGTPGSPLHCPKVLPLRLSHTPPDKSAFLTGINRAVAWCGTENSVLGCALSNGTLVLSVPGK
jgi:hypothetical protein